jgi:hypothetical protein
MDNDAKNDNNNIFPIIVWAVFKFNATNQLKPTPAQPHGDRWPTNDKIKVGFVNSVARLINAFRQYALIFLKLPPTIPRQYECDDQ